MPLFLIATFLFSIAAVQPGQPNVEPQLAAAPGLTTIVFASGESIWLAASHDEGQSFSAAREVGKLPMLMAGRHRGPRVVILGRTLVVTAISGHIPNAAPNDPRVGGKGDLVAWRSSDDGLTWSKPVVINDVPGAAREGLHAMAAGEKNEIAVAWLDLRSKGTRLYGAYSEDAGATWSKNVLLYEAPEGSICTCCHPSLATVDAHHFEVMFRNELAGNRDMYLAQWQLGGGVEEPEKLGTGSWKIAACPMDGGGVAHRGKMTETAWRRDRTLYLDEPGQPEMSLGDGKDPALALSSKGAYVIWNGASGIQLHRPNTTRSECLSQSGAYPTLASLPGGSVLAAWEDRGAIQLQIVP